MTRPGDLTVIGLDGSPLSADALKALARARLLVGGARHLSAVPVPEGARTIKLGPLAPAIAALSEHQGPAVVLASGDPGFFGILRALSEAGLEPASDRVIPAMSSVAVAFARVGLPWDDALVVSMHGSGDGRELRRAANVCRAHPKVALLTGPGASAGELARELMGWTGRAGGNGNGGSESGVARGGVGVPGAAERDAGAEGGGAVAELPGADGSGGQGDPVGAGRDEAGGEGFARSVGCAERGPAADAGSGGNSVRGTGGAERGAAVDAASGWGPAGGGGEGNAAGGGGSTGGEDAVAVGGWGDGAGSVGDCGGGSADVGVGGGVEAGLAVPDRELVVAARLGERDESVERLTLRQAASRSAFPEPNVVLCLADRPAAPHKRWLAGWTGAVGPWALAEDRYSHRDAQITKAEVRAQVLARLAPAPGDLVWDLGAGSGSVGIECARFGAAVVAVERDAESCARISANAAAHGVEISVVHGAVPEVLPALPLPDAVFVGGGGTEVVRAALAYGPRRLVVALAAVERVGEVAALLREDADREVDGVLLQASRLATLPGDAHRFAARNPVFVLWGDRP